MIEDLTIPGVDYEKANDPKHKAASKDPGWKYAYWPNTGNKDRVKCSRCDNENSGGIKRFKWHLIGGHADVIKCPNTTKEIAKEMRDFMDSKRKATMMDFNVDGDDDSIEVVSNAESGASIPSSGSTSKRKRAAFQFVKPQPKDKSSKSVVSMLRKSPEEIVDERHAKTSNQTTIENSMRTKEEKERLRMHFAYFFYENGIAFNVANSRSFEVLVEAIGQYGPGFKPPTVHDWAIQLINTRV